MIKPCRYSQLFVVLLLLLSACGAPEVSKDYLNSRAVPPLQLPTDLDQGLLKRQGPLAKSLTEAELQALDPDALLVPPQIVDATQGDEEGKAAPSRLPVALQQDDSGVTYLLIEEADYDLVWREIRLSLLATGFTLTDMNRSDGLFYIRYKDPDDEREEYAIQVIRAAGGSRVLVRSVEGQILATEAAARILALLKTNL